MQTLQPLIFELKIFFSFTGILVSCRFCVGAIRYLFVLYYRPHKHVYGYLYSEGPGLTTPVTTEFFLISCDSNQIPNII